MWENSLVGDKRSIIGRHIFKLRATVFIAKNYQLRKYSVSIMNKYNSLRSIIYT